MDHGHLYPYLLQPVYKDYPWGGRRIPERFGRVCPDGPCAEAWEVADHRDGMSVVRNGPLVGQTLRELVELLGTRLLGARAPAAAPFPLLVKLIDARERLSLQVHPDATAAADGGGEPKSEMWYLLDGAPGAQVFAGLRPDVTAEQFQTLAADRRVEELLCRVPVAPGDAVYIPGGRVHAVDAGCLLLEIQQNSNTTYRLQDWGRRLANGQPRELHLEQALRAMCWEDHAPVKIEPGPWEDAGGGNRAQLVFQSPFFRLDRLRLQGPWVGTGAGATFHIVFVSAGRLCVEWRGLSETLPCGTSSLVPAALEAYTLRPEEAPAEALRVSLP